MNYLRCSVVVVVVRGVVLLALERTLVLFFQNLLPLCIFVPYDEFFHHKHHVDAHSRCSLLTMPHSNLLSVPTCHPVGGASLLCSSCGVLLDAALLLHAGFFLFFVIFLNSSFFPNDPFLILLFHLHEHLVDLLAISSTLLCEC